ncbi:MAG: MotA/TolQ/ExbB proton channel family protein [Desulfobacterales bacterium]|uniref:MotA/TolQ/ExbB proton channel family protein n=1 Tax=Candidatus Desulfatibia profunda TaxID=2841695 RepID=A0A8J6NVZ8_9BACT|nr:MotA/TolQ/ExbB proton channel family protein [Candidatus Desulfatibia profunda]MBL7179978.1 MotA/TolQ/ExbB proton channel family protein [Desulfobacterales bacterium]
MDLASFVGIISGIFLIITAILMAGDVNDFFNIPGLMIVMGGTVSTTLLTFQFKDVLNAFRAAYFVFTQKKQDPNNMVSTMIKLSEISRRQGLCELGHIKTTSRFLKKACSLISDVSKEEEMRSALRTEIESLKMRHFIVQDIFRKMGLYSPAFGMLGTLIGLVQMLSKLQDPSMIGPSMAIAILTTFYGSVLSTMFFLPVAGKLKSRTIIEVINLEIIFEGAICILDNNNPIIVYERLSSYIPAKQRRSITSMRTK